MKLSNDDYKGSWFLFLLPLCSQNFRLLSRPRHPKGLALPLAAQRHREALGVTRF